MDNYQCTVCGWIYSEAKGYPEGGIPPKTRFEDLPESWHCPFCAADKDAFIKTEFLEPQL